MVQDAPQIMEFQTHPCGVEVVLEEIVEGRSEGFRRTLVGLKYLAALPPLVVVVVSDAPLWG